MSALTEGDVIALRRIMLLARRMEQADATRAGDVSFMERADMAKFAHQIGDLAENILETADMA